MDLIGTFYAEPKYSCTIYIKSQMLFKLEQKYIKKRKEKKKFLQQNMHRMSLLSWDRWFLKVVLFVLKMRLFSEFCFHIIYLDKIVQLVTSVGP